MDTDIGALTVVFTEFYYWITVALMFLIHVGFCMYEVGASRQKNHLHTLLKNTMLIPLVTITWFFFGWWIYWAFAGGPGITGGIGHPDPSFAEASVPWSEGMGPRLDDRITGVFWAAFLLFAWTAASIVSGAVIERIRKFAFWMIAILIGSVTWSIDAAWGWSYGGWMVEILGYHDAYASGVIHAIAGGCALGVLVVLGPRLGKFAPDGTPRVRVRVRREIALRVIPVGAVGLDSFERRDQKNASQRPESDDHTRIGTAAERVDRAAEHATDRHGKNQPGQQLSHVEKDDRVGRPWHRATHDRTPRVNSSRVPTAPTTRNGSSWEILLNSSRCLPVLN